MCSKKAHLVNSAALWVSSGGTQARWLMRGVYKNSGEPRGRPGTQARGGTGSPGMGERKDDPCQYGQMVLIVDNHANDWH